MEARALVLTAPRTLEAVELALPTIAEIPLEEGVEPWPPDGVSPTSRRRSGGGGT